MRDRKIGLAVVGVIAIAIVVAVWQSKRCSTNSDTAATSSVTQPSGGSSGPAITTASRQARSSIAVTVTDTNGPIAGAAVRVAPEDGEVIVVRTDSSGVAIAKGLEAGKYDVSASALDHEPAMLPQHELGADDDARLAITLVAGGRTLSGTVVDGSGGRGPIAGVRIDAARIGAMARPGGAVATATTGPDGKYQLTVSEGQLLVAARSPDYAAQSRYVDVGPSGATADFSLVPGGVIEGVVLDEKTKQPVGGAEVSARRDQPAMLLAEAGGHFVNAGTDGRFRISGLRPGAYELDARGDGKISRAPTVIGVGVAEQLADVQILIGRGVSIRGKVVDDANAPVANANVLTIGDGRGVDAKTDAKGEFAIEGASPGKHVLMARGGDHVTAGMTPVEVKDTDVTGVIVHVQRGFKIKGHVEPRQQADITLEPEESETRLVMIAPTATDAQGNFELGPALGKGTLSARCASGDQGELAIDVTGPRAEVVIKVAPGGSIAGRVVDGDNKPVAGASVSATPTGPAERTTIVNGMVTSGFQTITNANGAYEVRGLAPGAYRLGVLDRGRPLRMRKQVAPVKLAAAERKTGVELAVDRPNGVIKGVVTGPDGKPLADAWVSVHQDLHSLIEGAMRPGGGGMADDEGPPSRMVMVSAEDDGGSASAVPPALTDAGGRFEITGLAHSSYDVIAEAQAGKLRGRAERIKPDATVNLQALGLTTLSGTVKGPNGPAALFTLDVDGPTRTQRSFTDGTFELGRVDPGKYTLRVASSDGNGEVTVTVAPNTPATAEITLVANAVIVGTVVDAQGKPIPNVGVTVIPDGGGPGVRIAMDGPPPTSGPDGKFRVEHKAGAAILVLMTQPRPTIKRGLTLEAGKTLDVGAVRVEGPPEPP